MNQKKNNNKTSLVPSFRSRVRKNIESFGAEINRPDLAEIVEHLYDSALQESSKKTYGTGQRAYFRFVQELKKEKAYVPFLPKNLSRTELYLAFYIAYLVLKPTVNKATTILAYEGHVKYFFREQVAFLRHTIHHSWGRYENGYRMRTRTKLISLLYTALLQGSSL